MSAAKKEEEIDTMHCCANCGVAGGDDITLKRCNGCHLMRYCGVKCQRDHWPKHKRECKKKAAELKDEILFKQPESSYLGDCPICCLPLPIDQKKATLNACCSKVICNGCHFANMNREFEGELKRTCPFCRKAAPKTREEINEQMMKRVKVNDPVAICDVGTGRYHKGDYNSALEYWTKAADLGYVHAHFQLSILYQFGEGVEKDEKKEFHHLTEAAIAGHPAARCNLACLEGRNGRVDRAAKHYIIAAKLGCDASLQGVKNLHKAGLVSKEDLVAALRGHQAAIDATTSPQREEAKEYAEWVAERKRRGV